jgi:hypothetical protein
MPHPFPVAVRCKGDKEQGWGADAWVFFARVASQSVAFSPELLPMLTPEIRRIVLLLQTIPREPPVCLSRQTAALGSGSWDEPWAWAGVDETTNSFRLTRPKPPPPIDRTFPLDRIRAVYRGADDETWFVDMRPYHDTNPPGPR